MPVWWEKLLSFIGFSDSYEDGDEDEGELSQVIEGRSRKRAPVLSLHSASDVKIVVVSPVSFEESERLAGHLKNRRPVIINLEFASKETAQRMIDFLSGAVFALNGSTCKVAAETFLFNPSNVSVYPEEPTGDLRDRLSLKWDQGVMRDSFQDKG